MTLITTRFISILILIAGFLAEAHTNQSQNSVSVEKKTTIQKEQKADHSLSSVWVKGSDSVVRLKGQLSEESASCKVFQIKMDQQLKFKVDCAGHTQIGVIPLQNQQDVTVTHNGAHTTVTKYAYMPRKARVSRFKQATLKVPYVEEMIHLKKNSNGELSFYFESFRVDEFGRIVQDKLIQAYSLKNAKMNISAN